MTPELQTFAQKDASFRQFCEQYKRVASDPKTRDEYFYWWLDESRKVSIEETLKADGRREKALEAARNFLAPEQVACEVNLSLANVLAL